MNTMFYVGYLAFQWPGHYLMQRLPFGRYIAVTVFAWAVVTFLHCASTSYAPLMVMRLLLGASEAVVVPAMEITIGMFFDRAEQQFLQPILWVSCQGAPIVAGFIAYGMLHTTGPVLPWKLLHIAVGGITFLLAVWVWFEYPNNPADARFLSIDERVQVIRRVHASHQSSIEQKRFKPAQFWETLRDPVSWLFTLQAFTLMYGNNLMYGQKNLLVTSLGLSSLDSTLVAVAGGGFGMFNCVVAAIALRRWPMYMAAHATFWCLPAVAGGIGMVTLPWDRTIPLLACLFLAGHCFGVAYIIGLGWSNATAAGYTKKLTRNVMFMLAYSVGNLISPQIWVQSQKPRYYGAWISMISVSWVGTPTILWIIYFVLARRNKHREAHLATLSEDEKAGVVEHVDETGAITRTKVDLAVLDLTDIENKHFLYPL